LTLRFIIGTFFLTTLTAPMAFGGQAEDFILKGNAFVQKKDYDEAIKEYGNALKADPKNAKAHLLLGLIYANKGELDKALKFTHYALTLEKSYSAFHNLALIYANKGEYQNAADAYESALLISPKSASDWYQLGLLHAGNNRFDEGITAYKKVIELNPRIDDAYLGLGAAYYWNGDKSLALEQVKKLRELKFNQKADALLSWIKNNESKKREFRTAATAKQAPETKPQPDTQPPAASSDTVTSNK